MKDGTPGDADPGPGTPDRATPSGHWGWYGGALVGLPVLMALLPLVRGWPRGHDWRYELVKIAEFGHSVGAGQIPPHWAENLYGGFGSAIFLFYAPLYAAAASAAGAVLGSVPWGGVLALAGFMIVGACAMYRTALLMTGGRPEAARVAVAVFVLHPYVTGDVYLRNATSEFAALCLTLLALWGILELLDRPRKGAARLAGGLGLTIVTHNITALVVCAVVSVMGIWLHRGRGLRSRWLWLFLGVGLALGMSAFFWVPALALKDLVQTDTMTLGRFDFRENFSAFGSLFGYSRFFGAGWLSALILAAGLGGAIRWRRDPSARILRVLVAIALALIALMTPLTTVVWAHTPLLPYLQFPWRLQGPLAVVTALVAAYLFSVAGPGWSPRRRQATLALVLALAAVNALPHLLAAQALTSEERAWAEGGLTPTALRSGIYKASVLDEYLPVSADLRALDGRSTGGEHPVRTIAGTTPVLLENRGSRISLELAAESETQITLERWDFPGWRARVDGQTVPTGADSLGLLQVSAGAGAGRVELRKRAPLIRRAALGFSAICCVLWLGLVLAARRE